MLTGIIADYLGSGKTTCLTFVGVCRLLDGYQVFSNYGLKFEHKRIGTLEDFEAVRYGTFLGDDFYSWCDARFSHSERNQFVTDVLLKSRKRKWDIHYTGTHELLFDWRLRNITEFFLLPTYVNENYEMVEVFDKHGHKLQTFTFVPKEMFLYFDTEEEVQPIEVDVEQRFDAKVNALLLDERFLNLKTKSAKIAYIRRFKKVKSRDDCYLIADLVGQKMREWNGKEHDVWESSEQLKGLT